jgi:carboxylesterase type B
MHKIYLTAIIIFSIQNIFCQSYCIYGRVDAYLFNDDDINIDYNVMYGEAINYNGENELLSLDIYYPNPEINTLDKKPLVVFFHGGSLSGGDKGSDGAAELNLDLAKKGFVYASVNYRLGWNELGHCEGDTLSLQYALYRGIQDAKASLRFLISEAAAYNIDTNFIFLSGNSAGSILAMYAAYAIQNDIAKYLCNELGSIDSSTNLLFESSTGNKWLIINCTGYSKQTYS